jgi:hypothetical protein
MTSADANKEAGVVSVPVSAIEVEILDVLQIAIIRNPPADLAQFGVCDGATWRQYGDESGYDFFDPIMKGERALPVGEAETWIFAGGDREILIRGMLTADDAVIPVDADAAFDPAPDPTLEELVLASMPAEVRRVIASPPVVAAADATPPATAASSVGEAETTAETITRAPWENREISDQQFAVRDRVGARSFNTPQAQARFDQWHREHSIEPGNALGAGGGNAGAPYPFGA